MFFFFFLPGIWSLYMFVFKGYVLLWNMFQLLHLLSRIPSSPCDSGQGFLSPHPLSPFFFFFLSSAYPPTQSLHSFSFRSINELQVPSTAADVLVVCMNCGRADYHFHNSFTLPTTLKTAHAEVRATEL